MPMRAWKILWMFALPVLAAWADLEIPVRKDKVELTDGTVIDCTIIAATERGVLIVETDPDDPDVKHQRTISRKFIKKIERGPNEGANAGLQTEGKLGRKVIVGSGFDDEIATKGKKEDAEPKKTAVNTPRGKKDIVFEGKAAQLKRGAAAGGMKGTPQELADAYLQQFPALNEAAQALLGDKRVPQMFEQVAKGDGASKAQIESFLKVFVGNDTSAISQAVQNGAGVNAGATTPAERRRRRREPKQ
jgi:hypothetical protein